MQASNTPIVVSVKELTLTMKSQIEPLFRNIWVRGEVSNVRTQASGHVYFSLSEELYQIQAIMFHNAAKKLPMPITNGLSIIAQGEVTIYPPRGTYQLVVQEMACVGVGNAMAELQALKQKLANLGWFKQERKRALPKEITTIGVITSPTGAVIRDILTILTRRAGSFSVIINPVRVQGDTAALEIAQAIRDCNTYAMADVLIVCRGGGSADDLAAFNDERVAQACVLSQIPIIAAIGHETDLSITDLVADIRAPTPSAAAEIVSKERMEQYDRLTRLTTIMHKLMKHKIETMRQRILIGKRRLEQASPLKQIEFKAIRLDDIEASMVSHMRHALLVRQSMLQKIAPRVISPATQLTRQRISLSTIEKTIFDTMLVLFSTKRAFAQALFKNISSSSLNIVSQKQSSFTTKQWPQLIQSTLSYKLSLYKHQLESISTHISSIHPQRTLERGYAIVTSNRTQHVVKSIEALDPSDSFTIRVADGSFTTYLQQKDSP